MADKKVQTLQDLTDALTLPPLQMALAHEKDAPESNAFLTADIKSAMPPRHVEARTVMKLIEHLEQKD